MWPFQKNPAEKLVNEELEAIIDGIGLSPLPFRVKREAEEALRRKVKEEDTLSRLVLNNLYAAPETNFRARICDYALSVIGPIMQKAGVADANGKDTYTHIYVSIGGKKQAKYEVG